MKKLFILLPLVAIGSAVMAQDAQFLDEKPYFTQDEVSAAKYDPLRFTIDPASVKVELMSHTPAVVTEAPKGAIGTIVDIINIASKIWGIIKQNAPVVDVETKYAAAVPRGATAPNQLCEWKGPETYEYKFHAKNLYGMETVAVSYKVLFAYGGKWENKGNYLTGVTVVPGSIKVSWGYKLSMSAFVADTTIINTGTYENPMAAMQLKLSSKIASVLKEWNGESVYLISGDGKLKEIVSPFPQPVAAPVPPIQPAPPIFNPATVFGR